MADVIATVDNSMIKSDPDHLNLEFHDLAEKVVFKSKFRSVYNRILPPELLVNCPTKPVPKFLFYTRVIYKTLGLKHLVLILLFNLYAGFGGVLFYSIEGLLADENQSKVLADDTRNLSFKMSRLYNNSALDSTMKLNKSVSMILRYQMRSDQWPDLQKTNWDMTGSVFYAVTIFAGIGELPAFAYQCLLSLH